MRMPVTHDMQLHIEQMKSFYRGLAAGKVFPGWEEDTNRGFGAPTSTYYPPATYYVTSLFFTIIGDWFYAILATYFVVITASGAAFYLFARRFMSTVAAVLGTLAYLFLPYHIVDQYQRGAMAELLGFIWMPLILYFAERIFAEKLNQSQRLNLVGLAASYGAFLFSHPPTAFQFTMALGLWIAIRGLLARNRKAPIWIGAALGIGLVLSAAYLLPASREQEFIRHEYVSVTWPYHGTYVFLHDFDAARNDRRFFNLIDGIWLHSVAMMVGSALTLFAARRRDKTGLFRFIVPILGIGLFVEFMMLELSAPLGRLIPRIEIGVFTWRMLGISTFVVAFLAGCCAQAAMSLRDPGRRASKVLAWSVSLFILIGGTIFSLAAVARPMLRAPMLPLAVEHINLAMVPRTAPDEPLEYPVVPRAELEQGNGNLEIQQWDPEERLISVNLERADRLLIRTFVFPKWKATVDGIATEIKPGRGYRIKYLEGTGSDTSNFSSSNGSMIRDGQTWQNSLLLRATQTSSPRTKVLGEDAVVEELSLGDISFDLEPGTHLIRLEYTKTPAQKAGILATTAAALLLVGLLASILLARKRRTIRS